MAEKSNKRAPRIRKSAPTMRQQREQAEQKRDVPQRRHRISVVAHSTRQPLSRLRKFLGQEYYLPLPDGRIWNFLNKRRYFTPKYVKASWQELKQVTWPGQRETWRLTGAVFTFAIIFGAIVTIVDKGLEKVFKSLILP